MAIPYIQPSMAFVRAVDGTYISYPFIEDGDKTTKVYNMVCTQLATDYDASQIELDTRMGSAAAAGVLVLPFPADSDAFFVGDTGHAPIGGGMISFNRTFCNVPQSKTIASGSEQVDFPGLGGTLTANTQLTVSNITMTPGTKGVTITTSVGNNLNVGDIVFVFLKFTVGSDPFIYTVSGNYPVLSQPTSSSFVVDIGHYWESQVTINLDFGEAAEISEARAVGSQNVSTLTRYDYLLPGVTPGISSVLDIELPKKFRVVGTTGAVVSVVTDTVTLPVTIPGTIPSRTDYVEMIKDGSNIIIESSLTEWAGNILALKTKTCKAQ
jgi:hypothetical protein